MAITTLAADALSLVEASELRDEGGRRRYGSIDTLRRRVKSGVLPHQMHGGKYYVAQADLDALREKAAAERAYSELRAAAKRAASLAPPISRERRELIAAILRGA